MRYQGIPAVKGKELGKVFRAEPMPEYDLEEKSGLGPEKEGQIFRSAVEGVLQELQKSLDAFSSAGQKMKADITEVQMILARDKVFHRKVEGFLQEGFSAAAAVGRAVRWEKDTLSRLADDYIKERSKDVEDMGNRLICRMMGRPYSGLSGIDSGVILVARDLLPSALMSAPEGGVRGIVLAESSPTSHVAILAGGMQIPTLVGCAEEQALQTGSMVFLNASEGFVEGPLGEAEFREAEAQVEAYRALQAELRKWKNVPARTSDGVRMRVLANIMGADEAGTVSDNGGDGVGLFRTEFLFLNRASLPSEEEQFRCYREAAEGLGGLPLTIRTIDVGADKKVGGLGLKEEENPALGYRAVRICMDREDLFLTQLRAALRASACGKIKIMFPMVSGLQEVRKAKAAVNKAKEQLRQSGIGFDDSVQIGIMVEIPSAAIMADRFAKEVDFFSIGSNDLTQYTLAADRLNAKVAPLYDYLHPAVLALIENTIRTARKGKIGCSVCGEMAADPMAIPLLLGFGLEHFSMSPAKILQTKEMISHLDTAEAEKLGRECLEMATAEEVRRAVSAFLARHAAPA